MQPDQIRYTTFRIALALLCAFSQPALSVAAGADVPAAATVPDLTWMSGQWRAAMGDTIVEETWSTAGAGAMMGMFRLHGEARVQLYEFMLIEVDDEGLVLRLKHFSPGLRGWEEKDESLTFRLIDAEPQRAVFLLDDPAEPTHLIYERSADQLTVTLKKTTDDQEAVTVFAFHLQ